MLTYCWVLLDGSHNCCSLQRQLQHLHLLHHMHLMHRRVFPHQQLLHQMSEQLFDLHLDDRLHGLHQPLPTIRNHLRAQLLPGHWKLHHLRRHCRNYYLHRLRYWIFNCQQYLQYRLRGRGPGLDLGLRRQQHRQWGRLQLHLHH